MIAMEFWDGIVAYISVCVGLITSDEAGKLYCATISPKAVWALFATKGLSQQMRPRTSRLGKQNISRAVVLTRPVVLPRPTRSSKTSSKRIMRTTRERRIDQQAKSGKPAFYRPFPGVPYSRSCRLVVSEVKRKDGGARIRSHAPNSV